MDIKSGSYRRLGLFTFWMFVLQNCIVAISGILIFIVLLAIKASGVVSELPVNEGAPNLESALGTIINLGLMGSFALFIAGSLVALLIAFIQYFSYRYTLGEHEMHIKRGILNTDEITIPYRHIVDIEIERPLIYQILGASILTIYSRTDTNSGDGADDESEGRLPAIRRNFAETMRTDLLHKAHEQDIGRD